MFVAFLILIYLLFILKISLFVMELGAAKDNEHYYVLVGCFTFLVGIFIPIHIFLCSNVWWYGEKVVPPEINITLNPASSWSKWADLEPLLGEEITQDEDGNYFVTITDHHFPDNSSGLNPSLEISLSPQEATLKKAETTLTITRLAMENPPSWISDSSHKDQVTTLNENFIFTIDGSNLRYNKKSEVEPTKYRIVAQNKRGEASAMLTITCYSLYQACELYNTNHPGRSAEVDVPLCKERAKRVEENKSTSNTNSANSNSNNSTSKPSSSDSSNSTSKPISSSSTCLHYEAGRCWDDLEEEAYSQGQWDKLYGHYGDSYYESDSCDSVCQSILEDAYDEGYDDY